jgi:hypothetical protein
VNKFKVIFFWWKALVFTSLCHLLLLTVKASQGKEAKREMYDGRYQGARWAGAAV